MSVIGVNNQANQEAQRAQAVGSALVGKEVPQAAGEGSAEKKAGSDSDRLLMFARREKALQEELNRFKKEKESFGSMIENAKKQALEEYKKKIQSNPLAALEEDGITYDKLTELAMAVTPEQKKILEMERKLAEQENMFKTSQQKAEDDKKAQYESAKKQIIAEAERLSGESEDFDLIKRAGAFDEVFKKIEEKYNADGVVMPTHEALKLVEEDLLEKFKPFLESKKLKSLLSPAVTESPENGAVAEGTDKPKTPQPGGLLGAYQSQQAQGGYHTEVVQHKTGSTLSNRAMPQTAKPLTMKERIERARAISMGKAV